MNHGAQETGESRIVPTRSTVLLRTFALLLSLIGIAIAIVILGDHLTVFEGDHAEGLLCSGAGRFDCNPVAAHPAAWMLALPLAMWGLLLYIAMAALSLLSFGLRAAERSAAVALGTLLMTMAVAADLYLGFVMITQIGTICGSCLTTYVINVLLAVILWIAFSRESDQRDWGALFLDWVPSRGGAATSNQSSVPDAAPLPAGAGRVIFKVAVAVVAIAGVATTITLTSGAVDAIRAESRQEAIDFLTTLRKPVDVEPSSLAGLPSRGPDNAPVTVVIAADFQCSWCRALSGNIAQLRKEHPGKIREIYLNSPLTDSCGPPNRENIDADDCWLAEAAACAAEQGKFWEFHDYLFSRIPLMTLTPSTVKARLADIGIDAARLETCIRAGAARREVVREVALRDSLKLKVTPAFVINGHAKMGGVSPWTLRAIVLELLRGK